MTANEVLSIFLFIVMVIVANTFNWGKFFRTLKGVAIVTLVILLVVTGAYAIVYATTVPTSVNTWQQATVVFGLSPQTPKPSGRYEMRVIIKGSIPEFPERDKFVDVILEALLKDDLASMKMAHAEASQAYAKFVRKTADDAAALKNKRSDVRWKIDNMEDLLGTIALAGLLGVLNLWIVIPIVLRGMSWGGKITATTVFLIVTAIVVGLNEGPTHFVLAWFLGEYPPGIGNAIKDLVGLGFMMSLFTPIFGIITFGISTTIGMITTSSKGAGLAIGALATVVIIPLAFATEVIGLIPGWANFLGIVSTMQQYPDLLLAEGVKAVALGGIIAPGITSLLGTAWTLFSTFVGATKFAKASGMPIP